MKLKMLDQQSRVAYVKSWVQFLVPYKLDALPMILALKKWRQEDQTFKAAEATYQATENERSREQRWQEDAGNDRELSGKIFRE